jgi:hypothetical protein
MICSNSMRRTGPSSKLKLPLDARRSMPRGPVRSLEAVPGRSPLHVSSSLALQFHVNERVSRCSGRNCRPAAQPPQQRWTRRLLRAGRQQT